MHDLKMWLSVWHRLVRVSNSIVIIHVMHSESAHRERKLWKPLYIIVYE